MSSSIKGERVGVGGGCDIQSFGSGSLPFSDRVSMSRNLRLEPVLSQGEWEDPPEDHILGREQRYGVYQERRAFLTILEHTGPVTVKRQRVTSTSFRRFLKSKRGSERIKENKNKKRDTRESSTEK